MLWGMEQSHKVLTLLKTRILLKFKDQKGPNLSPLLIVVLLASFINSCPGDLLSRWRLR
jgi:hypothetical protein